MVRAQLAYRIKVKKPSFFKLNNFDLFRITIDGPKKIKEYSESDEFFRTTNYIALNNLGLVYLNLKKLDLAILNFNKALKLNQNYSPLHHNIGNYY